MAGMKRKDKEAGCLVLVKVRGYPPWPARIVRPEDHSQQPKKDKVFVYFLGSKEVGFYNIEDLVEFEGEARNAAIAKASGRSTKQTFKDAVAEALEEEKQRGGGTADGSEQVEEDEATPSFQTPLPSQKTASAKVKTPRTEPASRSAKKAFHVDEPLGERTSIVDAIKSKNSKVVRKLAKDWVGQYEKEASSALASLLTSLFQCCGVDYTLQEEEDLDVDDIVPNLVAVALAGGLEDLLSSRQKDARNFKQNLLEFWDALVSECQDQILFETNLFTTCISFVIGMACASPRTLRHVATLVGLQLVTSFVGVARTIGELRETKQRQLNAERKKNKEGPRVESLTNAVAEFHKKITTVEEMMRSIFTGLFMHRYRDVDPEIRCACISSIGMWIEAYPALFLQDLYLKYIGWTLNDRDSTVRLASVSALTALYATEANISALGLFTDRFGPRMVELTDDIDPQVAVEAIKLLKLLLRHELLGDETMEPLCELLVDELPHIRHAVGELVHEHLIAQSFHGSDEDEKQDSDQHLKRLLDVMSKYAKNRQSGTYVLDALWEKTHAMQDWKCIVKLLLDDKTRNELSDEHSTNLIHVLNVSVKKSVGERLVPSADTRKVVLSKKEKDAHESNRKELTSALMKAYPELLRKFSVDSIKCADLVDIIRFMDLQQFALKRQESLFSEILQLVESSFFKHGDDELLESCVKTFIFCSTEGQGELQQTSEHALKKIVSELESKLAAAIKQAGEGIDEDDEDYSLLVNLKRAHWLQLSSMCISEEIIDDIISLLEDYNHLNDEVVELALMNLYLYVFWLYLALDANNVDEAAMKVLLSKREKVLQQLQNYLMNILDNMDEQGRKITLPVRVVQMLSDIWTLFSQTKLAGTTLGVLAYRPSNELIQKYWSLCEHLLSTPDKIFADVFQHKDEVMAAVAKLAAMDVVPKEYLAAQIVSHYVLHGKSVSETVKTFCNRVKQASRPQDQWKLFFVSMKAAYGRHMDEVKRNEYDDYTDLETFGHCKELSSKLAATYSGFGRQAHGPSIWKIVEAGIDYAFTNPPEQLSFLECMVLPFALKLTPSRMQDIIEDLESKAEDCERVGKPSAWRPFDIFVDHMREKASKPPTSPGGDHHEHKGTGRRGGTETRRAYASSAEKEKAPLVESDDEDELEHTPVYDVRRRRDGSRFEQGEPSSRHAREEEETQPVIREYTRKRKSEAQLRAGVDDKGDEGQQRTKLPAAVSQMTGGTEDVLLRDHFRVREDSDVGAASDPQRTANGWDEATPTQATEEQLPGASRDWDGDLRAKNTNGHAMRDEVETEKNEEESDDDLLEIDINKMPKAVSKRQIHSLSSEDEEEPTLLKRRRWLS